MKKRTIFTILILLTLSFSMLAYEVTARPLSALSPSLGELGKYSVLAGTTVTNTGATTITGHVGVSAGTAITGFETVVIPPDFLHSNDASAIAAQADDLRIFGELDQPCDQTYGAVELSATFPTGVQPGVYCSTSTFSLTGNLNLVGSGVWIFKTVSELEVSSTGSVSGGDPCNLWWRVGSSATIETGASFSGSIFAHVTVNMRTGASLNGRAIAYTGEVTLQANNINLVCVYAPTEVPVATLIPDATLVPEQATATSQATATVQITQVPDEATATLLPIVTGMPGTGGMPIRTSDFPWFLVLVGVLGAIALALGLRAYRRI